MMRRRAGLFLLDVINLCKRHLWYRRMRHALAQVPPGPGRRRLFVDVSLLALRDGGTGIQRVVRSYFRELERLAGMAFEVIPVLARPSHGYCELPRDRDHGFLPHLVDRTKPIQPQAGDHFLGLDLSAHLLPRHELQVRRWRERGTQVSVVVYDLLPITHPAFFGDRLRQHFTRWLETIFRVADRLLAISDDVAGELRRQLGPTAVTRIRRIHLALEPPRSAPEAVESEPVSVAGLRTPFLLMVGTVEPRKGHTDALAAFDCLWKRGEEVSLVIVGRRGWQVDDLARQLAEHPQAGRKLHWLANADDTTLNSLYRRASGLLMLSHAEGFCLPVAEAGAFGKPVLARDLPVLREHRTGMTLISDTGPEMLASAILRFLTEPPAACNPCVRLTWRQGALELLRELGLEPEAGKVAAEAR